MRIVAKYSHLNGEEFLLVHHKNVYAEIKAAIRQVDAARFKTKISKEKTMPGKRLYDPDALNTEFHRLLTTQRWTSSVYRYYVTTDRRILEQIVNLPLEAQNDFLVQHGLPVIKSYKQTDFVKDQIAIEVQFGKYAFVAYDLFVKHMLFYSGGIINVGVEVLPVRAMARDPAGGRAMSTGIAYFEGEVYNVLRQGRGNPPVPLLMLGVAP